MALRDQPIPARVHALLLFFSLLLATAVTPARRRLSSQANFLLLLTPSHFQRGGYQTLFQEKVNKRIYQYLNPQCFGPPDFSGTVSIQTIGAQRFTCDLEMTQISHSSDELADGISSRRATP